jgi:diacylglycerol kinase family enzyme
MVETRARGHATTLAAEAARAHVPLVVAVGGDGTLNEVVNGLVPLRAEYPVNVGALMTGRGRDACANLGLVRDPRHAARRLVEGHAVSVDVGLARWPGGHRYFLGSAGVGFDAVVAERAGGRARRPPDLPACGAEELARLPARRDRGTPGRCRRVDRSCGERGGVQRRVVRRGALNLLV